ncbi:MAG: thioesterase II family protein [Gammaproteobacteria bacterium]
MAGPSVSTQWLARSRPNPKARVRLFCFPYAGGGASAFHAWPQKLPTTVEVCAVHLPGRGNRFRESPFTQLSPLVQTLTDALLPHLTPPFAFFGHSMGALIGFELARQLRRQQRPSPIHLFVSGRGAPQIPPPEPPIHALPEPQFIAELQRFNGTPKEVIEHPELMQLLIPTLRADFAVCENYTYATDAPIDCSISAFGGLQDREVSRERLEAWRDQSRASFSLRMFPGDHFFLHTAEPALLETIAQLLVQQRVCMMV